MEINKDYIGVIREVNGFLSYQKETILHDDIFISEMNAMVQNDNRTLMDVQQKFTLKYPQNGSPSYLNYIYPNDYDATFVHGVEYPTILSYEEYKKKIDFEHKKLIYKYLENEETKNALQLLSAVSETDYQKRINEIERNIIKELDDYKVKIKEAFNYRRYVYAFDYKKKLANIIIDDKIKMYSRDQIGWKVFSYKIDEQISIYIASNFGYGRSSYFFCNLKYRGINILPYSATIDYYSVKWTDFIRHTRQFAPKRDSWDVVFDFVVDTVNMAKRNPEEFVKVWIMNEIEEMMAGLRAVMNNSDAVIKRHINRQNDNPEVGFYLIARNCSNEEKKAYEVLPDEMGFAYKVEKISGCLHLLDNLRQIQQLSPVIAGYIREIEQMNRNISPELDLRMEYIKKELKRFRDEYKSVQEQLHTNEHTVKSHVEEIQQLCDGVTVDRMMQIKKNYAQKYPEYETMVTEFQKLNSQKERLEKDINLRTVFANILNNCRQRITKYMNAV